MSMKYNLLIGILIILSACSKRIESKHITGLEGFDNASDSLTILEKKLNLVDKRIAYKFFNENKEFHFFMHNIFEFPSSFDNGDTILASDISILTIKNDSTLISEEVKILTPEGWNMELMGGKYSLRNRNTFLYLIGANPKDTIRCSFKLKTLETNIFFKIDNGYKLLSTFIDSSQKSESFDHMYKINLVDSNGLSKNIYHADKEKCGTQKPVVHWEGDLNSDSILDYIIYLDGDFCKIYVLLLSDYEKGYTAHDYSHWTD